MTDSAPVDDVQQRIDRLRENGAERFDPLGLRFIEVLSERIDAQQWRARDILDARLLKAITTLQARMEQARDATAVAALTAGASDGALRALVQRLEALAPAGVDARPAESISPRAELKSVRYFRKTWAKLSADKQVTQALNQAPKNAGPINSHMVVLRSLALMRDNAPDYLNRFMSYVDTLLCLEQGGAAAPVPAKTPRGRSR
ncbi:MAG: DUF2894 domain-containing protein [Burkholderiales bacterium]|nr:DUF2894 domain-containing protein [Burkholderiales bacterium]